MKKISKVKARKLTEEEVQLLEFNERMRTKCPVVYFPISPHALRFSHERGMDEIIMRHVDEDDCLIANHLYMSRTLSMVRLRKGKVVWMYNEFPIDLDTGMTVFDREAVKYEELTDAQQHFYSDAHAYGGDVFTKPDPEGVE